MDSSRKLHLSELSASAVAEEQQDSFSSRRDWLLLTLASIGKTVIYAVASFALWASVPLLFGLTVTTVASGSMEPGIRTGDVVAALPVAEEQLREGQVILYDDPETPGQLKLHRLIALSSEGLQTQGDANPTADTMLSEPEAVVGVGFIRVPYIGIPINWLHRGEMLPLGIFLGALLGAALLANLDRDLRRRDREARDALAFEAEVVAETETIADDETSSEAEEATATAVVTEHSTLPLRAHRVRRSSRRRRIGARFPRSSRVLIPLIATVLALGLVASAALHFFGTSASAAFSSSTISPRVNFAAAASFPKYWDPATFHWDYAEQSPNTGIAIDDAGPSLENGTVVGGVTRAIESNNRFVTLNGSSGQIYSQRFAGAAPNTFTLQTWFKTTTTRGGKLLGYGNSQGGASNIYDRHLYMGNSGTLTFGVLQSGSYRVVTSPKRYNDGAWHMVTVSMSATAGTTVYVDGAIVGSDAGMIRGQGTSSDGFWRVGYDTISPSWPNQPTSNFFGGSLDGTTLWLERAITGAEALSHFQSGR